ncbi:MAG: glutaredoxin family protein [Cyanobacteria bacterium]|nr:glutaredoxin family protein [Cyanobacteriota bacterium]
MAQLDLEKITLFVVPDCPLCANTRHWLEENDFGFEELDVANDHGALRRMYRLTRQGLVPVVSKGDTTIVRPSSDELEELLTGKPRDLI